LKECYSKHTIKNIEYETDEIDFENQLQQEQQIPQEQQAQQQAQEQQEQQEQQQEQQEQQAQQQEQQQAQQQEQQAQQQAQQAQQEQQQEHQEQQAQQQQAQQQAQQQEQQQQQQAQQQAQQQQQQQQQQAQQTPQEQQQQQQQQQKCIEPKILNRGICICSNNTVEIQGQCSIPIKFSRSRSGFDMFYSNKNVFNKVLDTSYYTLIKPTLGPKSWLVVEPIKPVKKITGFNIVFDYYPNIIVSIFKNVSNAMKFTRNKNNVYLELSIAPSLSIYKGDKLSNGKLQHTFITPVENITNLYIEIFPLSRIYEIKFYGM
jgi:hypothetical protein